MNAKAYIRRSPFSTSRVEIEAPAGTSAAEMLRMAGVEPGVEIRAWIVDVEILPGQLERTPVPAGVALCAAVVPATGNDTASKIGRAAATIAVMAVAGAIAGAPGASAGFKFMMGIWGATAAAFIASLAPPPPITNASSSGERGSETYALTGSRNQANLYGVVPRVYGRHRVYPPLAAVPFSELVGNDHYLNLLFCVGYGPLAISDLRIGDTPLSSFAGVSQEIREGRPADAPITLYPYDVAEEAVGNFLDLFNGNVAPYNPTAGGWAMRTTAPNTTRIGVDFFFKEGLMVQVGTTVAQVTIRFRVEYRLVGTVPWTTYYDPTFIEATTVPFRRGMTPLNVPAGQYEVRVQCLRAFRTGTGSDLDLNAVTNRWRADWSILRSIDTATQPTTLPNVAKVALRIKANDQLNGLVDTFNCVAQSYLDAWNGAALVETLTRNPAWAYLDVLKGSANARPADALTRVDLDGLKEWGDYCTAEGWTFDGVFDAPTTVWQALATIASAGRAAFARKDDLYSITIDRARTVPVQHFTPRNSKGFRGTRLYPDRPHAFKVRFANAAKDWQQDERIVYDDGYTIANATKFEATDAFGSTSADLAWRRGRYLLATLRLRPEVYELSVDAEHLVATRGDLVRVAHDVPLFGMCWGRVKSVLLDGFGNMTGITTDERAIIDAVGPYSFRFRLADGDTLTRLIFAPPFGEQSSFTFFIPIPFGDPMPAAGDLFMLGPSNEESVELVIKEIRPAEDLTSRLILVDHAPDLYLADTGPIPPYDSHITGPRDWTAIPPDAPVIDAITSDDTVAEVDAAGTITYRIVLSLAPQPPAPVPTANFQVQFRESGTGGWTVMPFFPGDAPSADAKPVTPGVAYDVRVRAVSVNGLASDWTTVLAYVVVGNTTPPGDVETFTRNGNLIEWTGPTPLPPDFDRYELRRNAGSLVNWAAGVVVGSTAGTSWDISGGPFGTQTYMVKAVDTTGTYSVNPAYLIVDAGDAPVANVVVTQTEEPTWSGVLTDGTVSAGTIIADDTGGLFWSGNDAALFWTNDAALFWSGSTYKAMTYVATLPNDPANAGATLTVTVTATAGYLLEYQVSGGGWAVWPGAYILGAADIVEVRVTTPAGADQGVVSSMVLTVDVPDLVETLEDVPILAGGSRLPTTLVYRAIVSATVTIQDIGTNARAIFLDDHGLLSGAPLRVQPGDGPLVRLEDELGNPVAGSVDATIKGY